MVFIIIGEGIILPLLYCLLYIITRQVYCGLLSDAVLPPVGSILAGWWDGLTGWVDGF